jgi:hypothetical protein
LTSDGSKSAPGTSGKRPVLLLVDVEPDDRKTCASGGWNGSREGLRHLEDLRRRLEDVTAARVELNWFLRADPQIEKTWGKAGHVVDACPRVLKAITDHGDSCGIHPHLWRWNARRGQWFNELKDPEWTRECLHTAIEAFRGIFGSSPESCRFGDRWLDQRAVESIGDLGIRYDLTIEPGLPDEPIFDDPHATGWLPDYRGAPREPYHPSAGNFLAAEPRGTDGQSLWMVPLTTTAATWRMVRRPPYFLRASRSPNLGLASFYVWPHLRTQLDLETKAPLSIVVRSGDLANERFLKNFQRTTRELVKHPALGRCEFTNPAAAIARWRAFR